VNVIEGEEGVVVLPVDAFVGASIQKAENFLSETILLYFIAMIFSLSSGS